MFTLLKTLLVRRRARHEVQTLTHRDLCDLDLTRTELLDFLAMPEDTPDRLAAMADLLGVPQIRFQATRQGYREMLRACGACRNRARCGAILTRGTPAREEAIEVCPVAMACLALTAPATIRAAA